MKKKILTIIVVAAVLLVPFSAFAATSDTVVANNMRCFFGFDTSKLTDQQKADVKDYSQKMVDLKKEFINKMVADGVMTKAQGDTALARIDEMQKNDNGLGLLCEIGAGRPGMQGNFERGGRMGGAMMGRGGMGGRGQQGRAQHQTTAPTTTPAVTSAAN